MFDHGRYDGACWTTPPPPRPNSIWSDKKMVKFSHTRYRALGPELIPVYSLIGDLKVDWSISEISRVALLVALRVALAL